MPVPRPPQSVSRPFGTLNQRRTHVRDRHSVHQARVRWLLRAVTTPLLQLAAPQALLPLPAPSGPNEGPTPGSAGVVLLVIDSRAENLAGILSAASGRLRLLLLDAEPNGIAQIAEHVRERRAIDTLLLACADEKGVLTLGGTTITVANLYAHEEALRRIGKAMSPKGRICLLGRPNQAERNDRALTVMLSRLTGVPVESSSRPAWDLGWVIGTNAPGST